MTMTTLSLILILQLAATAAAFISKDYSATMTTTVGTSSKGSSHLNAFLAPAFPSAEVVLERSATIDGTSANTRHSRSPSNLRDQTAQWLKLHRYKSLIPPANAAETTTVAAATGAAAPPTKQEIALLRDAVSAFYGTTDRDPAKALDLLSQVLEAWQRQPADEQAGLYRVRGDCYMALEKPEDAIVDYGTAIGLLKQPGVADAADPVELPASL